MTRRSIALSLAALVVASVAVAGGQAWFDHDCAMCTNMMSDEALMKNMNWEQHNITIGIVAVTTVKPDYLDVYRTAHNNMNATAQRLMKGEQMELCGSCTAMGKCMMMGAQQEYVETSTGDVWIVTSDNPEVVADLHKWVERNQEEMKKAQM
jgi:hypothetical protein